MLYIHQGLLQRYLRTTGQRLVWLVWGERNFTIASLLHERDDVGLSVQREADLRMTKRFHHYSGVDVLGQKQRSARMG